MFFKDGKKYFVIVPGGFNLLDCISLPRKMRDQVFRGASSFDLRRKGFLSRGIDMQLNFALECALVPVSITTKNES